MASLNLNVLAHWFLLSSAIYAVLGIGFLDYNGNRGHSTLGFLLSQGLSACLLAYFS